MGVQAIVRWAKENELKSFLLIEDDCVLTYDGLRTIDLADKQIRERGQGSHMDLLYYGANHTGAKTRALSPNLLLVNGSLTTHLVGVWESAYDAILDLKPTHVIDNLIARFLHPKLDCRAVWPAAAVQKPGFSYLWNQKTDYSHLFQSRGLEF